VNAAATTPPVRNQHTEPRAPQAKIPPPQPPAGTWLTIGEIADCAVPPVKYTTVEQWKHRRRSADIPFPEPDIYFGPFPVWRLSRVKAWFRATGKPFNPKLWEEKKAAGAYRRGPRNTRPKATEESQS